jgi:8-oxo-dGTP pyrophosphatase MutT (NUDIX family)
MADATPLERDYPDGAAALVVIARAARASGDKTLERAARRELVEKYGIDLAFRKRPAPQGGGS